MQQVEAQKILAVEDEDDHFFILQHLILRQNLCQEVVRAEHGGQAIATFYAEDGGTPLAAEFDLIFLDLNMPVMDGFEFLDELQKILPSLPFTPPPVVIMTSSANPEDKLRARSYSFVIDYNLKPYRMHDLRSILKTNTGDKN